jgi:hypothetical protein
LTVTRNELSLQVTNDETGKVTKSLPKARVDEGSDKREIAEGQFKILCGNIRKVAIQRALRIENALVCAKQWKPDSWRDMLLITSY